VPQNFVNVTLDTSAPTGLAISIENGSPSTSSDTVMVTISADAPRTGESYMLKMWGDVDNSDPNIKSDEATAQWFNYTTQVNVILSPTDGTKYIYAKIRDDVLNETPTFVSDSINLDRTKPVVSVTTPDRTRISLIATRSVTQFSFTVDVPFVEYDVRVVPDSASTVTAGTRIPIDGGSTNTNGTGTFAGGTPIYVTVNGLDLQTAIGGGEQDNITIKVFARDEADNWSF